MPVAFANARKPIQQPASGLTSWLRRVSGLFGSDVHAGLCCHVCSAHPNEVPITARRRRASSLLLVAA
eukprot:9712800-Prorocentrum_lima.AAC.1